MYDKSHIGTSTPLPRRLSVEMHTLDVPLWSSEDQEMTWQPPRNRAILQLDEQDAVFLAHGVEDNRAYQPDCPLWFRTGQDGAQLAVAGPGGASYEKGRAPSTSPDNGKLHESVTKTIL